MDDVVFVDPATLRFHVQIQSPGKCADEFGEPVEQWQTILSTRAGIENTTGLAYKHSFQDNTQASESTDLITIRWPGRAVTVEPGQRVVHGRDVYTVQAVDNVKRRNRVLRLACLAVDLGSN